MSCMISSRDTCLKGHLKRMPSHKKGMVGDKGVCNTPLVYLQGMKSVEGFHAQ